LRLSPDTDYMKVQRFIFIAETTIGKDEAALWSVREFELKSLRHEPKASAAPYTTRSFK
jgi:hypothetical protein